MGDKTYNREEIINMAKVRLESRNKWKDINKVTYFFEEYYPYHVLFRTEHGYKRCFTYIEVINNLY